MAAWRVELDRAVAAGLNVLSDEDRAAVERAMGRLLSGPTPPGYPAAYPLPASAEWGEQYLLAAGAKFRLLYTVEPDKLIVVRDILNTGFIRAHSATTAAQC